MNIIPELIGLCGGALNIASTFPHLFELWRRGRQGTPDQTHVRSRAIQLLANLVWLAYACHRELLALGLTSGTMSLCLVAVIWQHRGAPPRAAIESLERMTAQ